MKLFDGLVPGGPGGDGDGDGGGGGGGGIGGAGPNGDDAGDANRQILAALVGEGLGLDDDPLNDPLNWEGVFD